MRNTKNKNTKTPAETPADTQAADLRDDLRITKTSRRKYAPGTWVTGTVGGHAFEALVFPDHADVADYELGDSRISKLHLQRIADGREVYCWDRGLDVPPADAAAAAVADFLAAGLAEATLGT